MGKHKTALLYKKKKQMHKRFLMTKQKLKCIKLCLNRRVEIKNLIKRNYTEYRTKKYSCLLKCILIKIK